MPMGSLQKRVGKVEERLGRGAGGCLRWPNPNGTFIEVRGVRTLVDLYAVCAARGWKDRGHQGKDGHDGDRIRQNRTQ